MIAFVSNIGKVITSVKQVQSQFHSKLKKCVITKKFVLSSMGVVTKKEYTGETELTCDINNHILRTDIATSISQ